MTTLAQKRLQRIRALVDQRIELVKKAEELAESMRNIPKTKHVPFEGKLLKMSELSDTEKQSLIRFSNSSH